MGQYDVYKWLKDRRECGDDSYFRPYEVIKGLKEQGFSNGVLQHISDDLIALTLTGYLESEINPVITDWTRKYRIKKEYCNFKNG